MENTEETQKQSLEKLLDYIPSQEKGKALADIGRVNQGIEFYRKSGEYQKAIDLALAYQKPAEWLKSEAVKFYEAKIECAKKYIQSETAGIGTDTGIEGLKYLGPTMAGAYSVLGAENKIKEYMEIIEKIKK